MANLGGRVESYYARAMLEVRPTLHLALRLTIRTNQVLEHTGAASEGAGLWRAALPLFVLLDVAVWFVLRRSDRFGLRWRLPLDAMDAAFWTLSPLPASGSADLALLVVVPLAVEAGVRIGWRSLAVPASVLVSTTVAALVVGKPVQMMGVTWIALAAAVGMAFFRYCGHLHERGELERHRHLEAARWRAFLAGQNEVAMGASSAVDVMEGLVPVLGPPPPDSALWQLADGWKGQLTASTSQQAKYLQVALLEWERLHNSHPDLSSLAHVRIEEGTGTTLLSAAQVLQLRRSLDRMPLRGIVSVDLDGPAPTRLPGQELQLLVNGRSLTVPADRRTTPPPLDAAAAAYFYVGALDIARVLPIGGSLPPGPVAVGLILCAAAAFLSHRRTVSRGAKARVEIFVGAVGVATVLTALSWFARAPVTADGLGVMGFGVGLVLLSFVGGFYWTSLGRWRWLLPAAVAANVALGLVLFPVPSAVTARTVIASVLYNLFPLLPCVHLGRALERAAAEHAGSVMTTDEHAQRTAFQEGRQSVIGLVRQAREDALVQLHARGRQLDAGLSRLATDWLEEVERRLRVMGT